MQLPLREVGRVNKDFSQRRPRTRPKVGFDKAVLRRRPKGGDLVIAEDLFDSEEVKSVTDGNHPGEIFCLEKGDGLFDAFGRRQTTGLGKDTFARNVLFDQIGFANARFGIAGIKPVAAGSHDPSSVALPEERCRMLQPHSEYRRGPAVVLGGAEDHDDVCGLGIVANGGAPNEQVDDKNVNESGQRQVGEKNLKQDSFATLIHGDKYKDNSSRGIAPSRTSRAGSWVKSRIVEGAEPLVSPLSSTSSIFPPSC
jgi:hypothetical protein